MVSGVVTALAAALSIVAPSQVFAQNENLSLLDLSNGGTGNRGVAAAPGQNVAAAEVCTGGTTDAPEVYNFEVNGHPAKIIRDYTSPELTVDAADFFFEEEPEVLSRMLALSGLNDTAFTLSFNVLYIDLDGEGLLIDSGNGGDNGALVSILEGEGITRDSIKHVLLSHGHADHISGLIYDTDTLEVSFPEATHYISRIEYEYWSTDPVDPLTSVRDDEFIQGIIDNFRTTFTAVGNDSLVLFEVDEEPIPGFMPVPGFWHTPGHCGFLITDGDSQLLHTVDMAIHRIFTFENPWVTFLADMSSDLALTGRYEVLDMAINEGWQLLAYHSEFPGLMCIEACGTNYLTDPTLCNADSSATPGTCSATPGRM